MRHHLWKLTAAILATALFAATPAHAAVAVTDQAGDTTGRLDAVGATATLFVSGRTWPPSRYSFDLHLAKSIRPADLKDASIRIFVDSTGGDAADYSLRSDAQGGDPVAYLIDLRRDGRSPKKVHPTLSSTGKRLRILFGRSAVEHSKPGRFRVWLSDGSSSGTDLVPDMGWHKIQVVYE
jgi:hypothetical protein